LEKHHPGRRTDSMTTDSILNLIGKTPVISLKKMTGSNIYAKAEFLNPGGSIKDRIALYMIERAEEQGRLKPGMTIMEPTSGNTGIGLALVGVQKGYHVVIVMPENMSEERKKIISALGAELILTPAEKSISGTVEEVEKRAKDNPSIFVPQQFENTDNPETHFNTTAPELWSQLEGNIDIFVSGLGSGGTLCGVGRYLKKMNPEIIVVAVEPKNVSALLGHEPGLHKIQGIGDGFIPPVLDTCLVDQVLEVTDEDAVETARRLARTQGILAGTSSGANVWASCRIAEKFGKDKVIATILADRAERYFSTALI
jgi:cysteine synthase